MPTQAYIIPQITKASEFYAIGLIATNEANGDLLYAVDGIISVFEEDYPEAFLYYKANWFQNVYSEFPGETPLEKYLNGINGMIQSNPPNWANILPAISQSSVFPKLLTTQNPNAFSALQTVINYRNMDLFKSLAKATVSALPSGFTTEEIAQLDQILAANNFPSLAEIIS